MPMRKSPDPEVQWRNDMIRRLRSLETALRSGRTAIKNGGMRVVDASDTSIVDVGAPLSSWVSDTGEALAGIIVSRPDGTISLSSTTGMTTGVSTGTSILDEHSNNVVADDTVSGYGLAKPYIPIIFNDTDTTRWQGTTSGTFTAIQRSRPFQQHPKLSYDVVLVGESGATGEGQLVFRGSNGLDTVIAGPFVVTANSTTSFASETSVTLVSDYLREVIIELQIRRTNATGTVRGIVRRMYGVQS